MPAKQEKDSISISVELKYIIHPGGVIGELDEYPAPDQVRQEVQRLLKVVREKKEERKEAVFGSIELKLESIDVNMQKLKDPKQVSAPSAKTLMKDLRNGENYVRNCMSEAKYFLWCIETSKPRFREKELQGFDACLEDFNKTLVSALEEEARNSIKKTQADLRYNSVKIPEKIMKIPENQMRNTNPNRSSSDSVLSPGNNKEPAPTFRKVVWENSSPPAAPPPAPAISEQKKDLTRSDAMPKASGKNGSAVNNTAYSDQRVYGMPPEMKGQPEKHQSSNPTQKKDVKTQNIAHSSILSNTSSGVQPNNFHSGISSNTSSGVQPNDFHSGISSNTPREKDRGKDLKPTALYKTEFHSEPANPVAGLNISRETNREKDSASAAPPVKYTTKFQFEPANPVTGLNTSRETNKERNSASAAPLKPSGHVDGLNTWRESNKEKELPSAIASSAVAASVRGSSETDLDKDSSKMPKVKIEPIQLQTKPVPAMNLKMEQIQLQNKPAPVESEPIQMQTKPPPKMKLVFEPFQEQTIPETLMEFKTKQIQQQNKPAPMEKEPIQQHTVPSTFTEFKTEPIQLQTYHLKNWELE